MKIVWLQNAFQYRMKRKINRIHHFNLLEIVLALSVVAVGVVSIMGLFPIGVEANRKSQDNVYVTMAADTVANYLVVQRRLITDEVRYKTYKSPYTNFKAHKDAKKKMLFDFFYKMDTNERGTTGKADVSYLPAPPTTITDSNWEQVSDNDFGGVIYKLKGSSQISKATYRVVFKTPVGTSKDEFSVDFDCIVMVGLGEYEARSMLKLGNKRLPGPRLAVNVYWPSQRNPKDRQNRTFSRRLRVNGTHVYDWRDSKGKDL